MHFTHELELFPDVKVTQLLFKDVKNVAELRQAAISGQITGALINPTMVRDFHSLLTLYSLSHLINFSGLLFCIY